MKKKMIIVAVLVCCVFTSIITVNAVSKKDVVLGEGGVAMTGISHDTIVGNFHTSVYPTSKTNGEIKVYNEVYRKNILGQPKDKQTITHYVKEVNKSYIFNTYYEKKAWTKSDWWNQTKGSKIVGNFYLSKGHDTSA